MNIIHQQRLAVIKTLGHLLNKVKMSDINFNYSPNYTISFSNLGIDFTLKYKPSDEDKLCIPLLHKQAYQYIMLNNINPKLHVHEDLRFSIGVEGDTYKFADAFKFEFIEIKFNENSFKLYSNRIEFKDSTAPENVPLSVVFGYMYNHGLVFSILGNTFNLTRHIDKDWLYDFICRSMERKYKTYILQDKCTEERIITRRYENSEAPELKLAFNEGGILSSVTFFYGIKVMRVERFFIYSCKDPYTIVKDFAEVSISLDNEHFTKLFTIGSSLEKSEVTTFNELL